MENITTKNINVSLLKEQRDTLLEIESTKKVNSPRHYEAISGIINLLDNMLDNSSDNKT